jgi:hypothetical protein
MVRFGAWRVFGVFALFGGLCPMDVKADIVAFTPPAVPINANQPNAPVNLGLTFTANTSFSVDALGIFDLSDLTTSAQVGLYNSSGTLLASATVNLGGSPVNGYLFQSITPVALTVGNMYAVVENTGVNDWAYYDPTPPNTAAEITYDSSHYLYGSALADATFVDHIYYGPNFEIETGVSAVPEPSSVILVPTLLLVAFLARKRIAQGL